MSFFCLRCLCLFLYMFPSSYYICNDIIHTEHVCWSPPQGNFNSPFPGANGVAEFARDELLASAEWSEWISWDSGVVRWHELFFNLFFRWLKEVNMTGVTIGVFMNFLWGVGFVTRLTHTRVPKKMYERACFPWDLLFIVLSCEWVCGPSSWFYGQTLLNSLDLTHAERGEA